MKRHHIAPFILTVMLGLLLLRGVADLPVWGNPHSPAQNSKLGTHYIENTLEQTSVPNFVTAVLADYRGTDTLLETSVVFIAGMAIFAALGINAARSKSTQPPFEPFVLPTTPIVQTTAKLLTPVLQLFAFYVVAHGHHSPGGGFQGGVILAASFLVLALSFNLNYALEMLNPKRVITLGALGICIYAGTGFLALALGHNFLDYSALTRITPWSEPMAHSMGMLIVEIGVAFTVSSILFGIFTQLSTSGTLRRGL